MRIEATSLPGVALVLLDLRQDSRGFFARTFSRDEFMAARLEPAVEQCNMAFNHRAGTVRGMHYQDEPVAEAKLVRCTRGAIVDVAVDMRPGSPTRLRHVMVELTQDNRQALYIPPMFAHGYQTLVDESEVAYQVSAPYTPQAERGVRFDDPALGIRWPVEVTAVSEKDAVWRLL